MNNIERIDFYCLNFHSERREQMVTKLEYFQIPIAFYSGVSPEDQRIRFIENPGIRRTASICYGHLDIFRHFVDHSTKEFVIVMEDDILIKNTFVDDIQKAVEIVCRENLDVFLIGYLCHNPIHTYSNFPEIHTPYSSDTFRILEYPDSTWGAQMYLVSKSQAKWLIEKYAEPGPNGYLECSLENPQMIPFSADWLLTKNGKRALLYPLRVIENGTMKYEDRGQETCRIRCAEFTSRDGFI